MSHIDPAMPREELVLQYRACLEMNKLISEDNFRLQRDLETAHVEKEEHRVRANGWLHRYRETLLDLHAAKAMVEVLKEGATVASLTALSELTTKRPNGRVLEPGEKMDMGDYQNYHGEWMPVISFEVGRPVTADAQVIRPVRVCEHLEGLAS